MRTRFKVSHNFELKKVHGGNNATLSFQTEVSEGKYKTITVDLDGFEVRQLINGAVEYMDKVEEDAVSNLKQLRTCFRYSNKIPVITYEHPKQ